MSGTEKTDKKKDIRIKSLHSLKRKERGNKETGERKRKEEDRGKKIRPLLIQTIDCFRFEVGLS